MRARRPADAELLDAARRAGKHAWAPYSGFKVGAALRCADGTVVPGCNVENASFGLTICAERAALARAVSEGKTAFTAIAVVGHGRRGRHLRPCGACRQVLAEFGDLDVLCEDRGFRLSDLLPETFRFRPRRSGRRPR
ncbi:MAG: cytidine deaminase [Candidatus Brocadiae bacterium]|nr:cytidine deaminase [Candidatus Brocadiia bacterium]